MKKIITLVCLMFGMASFYAQNMSVVLCDFDTVKKVSIRDYTGDVDSMFLNPLTTGLNPSPRCARYVRKNIQYDNLKLYAHTKFIDIGSYAQANTVNKISMMVMSKMPAGTIVEIQMGSRVYASYPQGIHSIYTATTTVSNQWELLIFSLTTNLSSNGGFPYSGSIDKMVVLFNPTSTASDTVYFDLVSGPPIEPAVSVNKLKENKPEVSQNIPNPAKDKTSIQVTLPYTSNVTLKVFDMLGHEVLSGVQSDLSAGEHKLDLDTSHLGSGVYFYSVNAGDFKQTRRMVVNR